MPIVQAIIEHKELYENAGRAVPPYRLTCKEHKRLVEHVKELVTHGFNDEKKYCGMIRLFYGVALEVVMIVDDYI